MMEDKQERAFPSTSIVDVYAGLTKREYFAGLAMQGILANAYYNEDFSHEAVAKDSVRLADFLLDQLEK